MPPKDHRIISKQDLLRKYQEDNWERRLAERTQSGRYEQTSWPCGNHKMGHKWVEGDEVICRRFDYDNGGMVIRELRDDDDIFWYIVP